MPTPAQIIPPISDETEVSLTIPAGGGIPIVCTGPLVEIERMLRLEDGTCAALRTALDGVGIYSIRPNVRVWRVLPEELSKFYRRAAA